ncbi:MAG: hypothetical protein H5T66_12145 [Chloroflexi bacterium]|nr:hypothetical protein [Chloroflexota bacterium]
MTVHVIRMEDKERERGAGAFGRLRRGVRRLTRRCSADRVGGGLSQGRRW